MCVCVEWGMRRRFKDILGSFWRGEEVLTDTVFSDITLEILEALSQFSF